MQIDPTSLKRRFARLYRQRHTVETRADTGHRAKPNVFDILQCLSRRIADVEIPAGDIVTATEDCTVRCHRNHCRSLGDAVDQNVGDDKFAGRCKSDSRDQQEQQ